MDDDFPPVAVCTVELASRDGASRSAPARFLNACSLTQYYPCVTPESINNDWPGKTCHWCNREANVMGVTEYSTEYPEADCACFFFWIFP